LPARANGAITASSGPVFPNGLGAVLLTIWRNSIKSALLQD